jgi:hypothetical protein
MKLRILRTEVARRNSNQNVFRIGFGVFDERVKVPIIIKRPGIEEFVFEFFTRAAPVCFYQIPIRKFPLGIFVEILHVGVCRCAVHIEVVLLDVFAVIAFTVREAEEALFQDWVLTIPQRHGKAETLLIVGNTRDPSSPQR